MVESHKHSDSKFDLYWDLIQDGKCANVEYTIGRTRTDILAEINSYTAAIEIQYTPISIASILHRMQEHTNKGMYTIWLFPEDVFNNKNKIRNLKWIRFIQTLQEGVLFLLKGGEIIPARLDNSLRYINNTVAASRKILDVQKPLFLEELTFKRNEIYDVNITTINEWWLSSYVELL